MKTVIIDFHTQIPQHHFLNTINEYFTALTFCSDKFRAYEFRFYCCFSKQVVTTYAEYAYIVTISILDKEISLI